MKRNLKVAYGKNLLKKVKIFTIGQRINLKTILNKKKVIISKNYNKGNGNSNNHYNNNDLTKENYNSKNNNDKNYNNKYD